MVAHHACLLALTATALLASGGGTYERWRSLAALLVLLGVATSPVAAKHAWFVLQAR